MRMLPLAMAATLFITPAFAADTKPTAVLARVNGEDITRGQLDDFLKALPANVKQMPRPLLEPMALDQLINGKAILKAANAQNLSNDPEVQSRAAQAKEQITEDVYLNRAIDKKITDKVLKDEFVKFKKENPEQEEISARHMLVDTEQQAKDLIKQLDGGADFAKLAGDNNKGPEKANGGYLDFFTKKEVVPEFADAAFKLQPGQYTKTPVKSQFGWHVIELEDRRTRQAPRFDDVKDQLKQRLSQQLAQAELADLRKGSKIEIFQDNLAQMPKGAATPAAADKPAKK